MSVDVRLVEGGRCCGHRHGHGHACEFQMTCYQSVTLRTAPDWGQKPRLEFQANPQWRTCANSQKHKTLHEHVVGEPDEPGQHQHLLYNPARRVSRPRLAYCRTCEKMTRNRSSLDDQDLGNVQVTTNFLKLGGTGFSPASPGHVHVPAPQPPISPAANYYYTGSERPARLRFRFNDFHAKAANTISRYLAGPPPDQNDWRGH